MRRMMVATVLATSALALTLHISSASAQPAPAPAAAAAPAGKVLVPGHRYTAEELAAQRVKILAADQARFDAWKKGEVKKLDTIVAEDAKFVDGMATGANQLLNKTQFLARTKAVRAPKTLTASERVVRVFGVEDDVAIVNGVLKDSSQAGDKGGGAYTAIYLRTVDRSWELVRYQVSPFEGTAFLPEAAPAKPWSVDALSASQRRVMDVLRAHFDAMARREDGAIEKTIGDDFWYIRGGAPGGNQHGKAEYMAFKKNTKLAPELVIIDEPEIHFYGNYGEIAVVNGTRRDATGGAVFGPPFQPQWRTVANYTAVVQRPSTKSDVWVLQHYHAAYVLP